MNSIGMLFLVVLLFFLTSLSTLLSNYITFSIKKIDMMEVQSILNGFHEIKIFNRNDADILNMHSFLDSLEVQSASKKRLSEFSLCFEKQNNNAAVIIPKQLVIDLIEVDCN